MDAPGEVFSKATRPGQCRGGSARRGGRRARTIAAVTALAGALAGAPLAAYAGAAPAVDGFAPHYVTLKVAPVNARGGPGEDYKALWTFTTRGVPLQVVEETEDWRRVCDPEGGLAWVHRRTLDTRRTVMRTAAQGLPLRRAPRDDAPAAAVLAAHATAQLKTCRAGWCRIAADRASGWVREGDVWGASDRPQCRERGR